MGRLFSLAVVTLALLFAAAPADAACGNDGQPTVTTADVQGLAAVGVVASGHCQHMPCSDTSHNHMPGGCAGHSFVPAFAIGPPDIAIATGRLVFANDVSNGRTLLPPVPPPLA